MSKTKIRFRLTESEISSAIRQINGFHRRFLMKCDSLVTALTQEGAEIAKLEVAKLDAVDTGKLMDSIGAYFSPTSKAGIIRANSLYAIYVEFGTGVVGSESPHPNPNGYRYDINNHGDDGWVYYEDESGEFRWTKGFKSRPFMYNTARELETECERIAREVFGR